MGTSMATATATIEHVDAKQLLQVLTRYKRGDFTARVPVDRTGVAGKIYDTVNDIIEQNQKLAGELQRISNIVGKAGHMQQRASLAGASGGWAQSIDALNTLVNDMAEVTTAGASGDPSRKTHVDVKGETLELTNTINTMVDQLSSFASDATRVAREVGTDGKLGGQATVRGVGGVWKDLPDNVNTLAGNLTVQLRDVSKVATAIARGDLTQKITVDVRGELLQTKNVVNTMLDQLNAF